MPRPHCANSFQCVSLVRCQLCGSQVQFIGSVASEDIIAVCKDWGRFMMVRVVRGGVCGLGREFGVGRGGGETDKNIQD